MNAMAAIRFSEAAELNGAVVIGAEIAAGHDGAADLVVRLRHENGAEGAVVLDTETGFALMRAAGADSLDGLVGHAWLDILKGL
jgi:hypothetical protein